MSIEDGKPQLTRKVAVGSVYILRSRGSSLVRFRAAGRSSVQHSTSRRAASIKFDSGGRGGSQI
jgi:hypothetical protein